jgi:type II secretory pathway pseudopilin PulG
MKTRRHSSAYTLFEIMMVIAIIAAAMLGVMRLFIWTTVRAGAQREQTSVSALVEAVRGVYETAPSYVGANLSVVAQQSKLDDVLRGGNGSPISAFGGVLSLNSTEVFTPDDAFSIKVSQLSNPECSALIPALAGESIQVSTISGGNIQTEPNRVPDGAAIAAACSETFFQQGQGSVTFVYYRPRAINAGAATGPSCATSCAPHTESQTINCPGSEVGHLTQTRSDTCSNAACPSPIDGAWTTVSSSCAPAPPGQPITVTPPAPVTCSPGTEMRTLACPAGQTGAGIVEQQSNTCVGGVTQPGAWTTVSTSCVSPAAPPPPCTTGAISGVDACPAGQGGQVNWIEQLTCSGGGTLIGPKIQTSSSCTPSCVAAGNCCRPSSIAGAQQSVACSAGQFGQLVQQTATSSTCASATATPVFGPPQITTTTGACAACPAPATATQTVACPAGQTGSITQSQTTSYNCAAAPTTLPAPTVSAWTNTSNTCVNNTCSSSGGGTWSANVTSMVVGPIGGTPTASPYDTVTFNPASGIAYMKTGPTTDRFVATGSITFNLTVGAQTQTFTVACTVANSVLNSPGYVTTDECLYTGAVTLNGVTLNVTVDAGGLPAQDYVNGSAVVTSIQATIEQAGGCTPPPTCTVGEPVLPAAAVGFDIPRTSVTQNNVYTNVYVTTSTGTGSVNGTYDDNANGIDEEIYFVFQGNTYSFNGLSCNPIADGGAEVHCSNPQPSTCSASP